MTFESPNTQYMVRGKDAMVCPECGSTNILKINRICGYLGYSSNELGANMINNGKYDEVKRRVDHFTN